MSEQEFLNAQNKNLKPVYVPFNNKSIQGNLDNLGLLALDMRDKRENKERAIPIPLLSIIGHYIKSESVKNIVFFQMDLITKPNIHFVDEDAKAESQKIYMLTNKVDPTDINRVAILEECKRNTNVNIPASFYSRHREQLDAFEVTRGNPIIGSHPYPRALKIGTNTFLLYSTTFYENMEIIEFLPKTHDSEGKCQYKTTRFALLLEEDRVAESLETDKEHLPLPWGSASPHVYRNISSIVELSNGDLLALGFIDPREHIQYSLDIDVPDIDTDPGFYQSFADVLTYDKDVPIYERKWKKLATGKPLVPNRRSFKSVVLNDGRVLIAGGFDYNPDTWQGFTKRRCEYYNPVTMQFSEGPLLPKPDVTTIDLLDDSYDPSVQKALCFDMIKLPNGNVLFSGGGKGNIQFFMLDFASNRVIDPKWELVPDLFISSYHNWREKQLDPRLLIPSVFAWHHELVLIRDDILAIVHKTESEHHYPHIRFINLKTMKDMHEGLAIPTSFTNFCLGAI